MRSPLIENSDARLIREIPCNSVAEQYRRVLNIDVTEYFRGNASLQLFECLRTGYKFYYPYDLFGDTSFYGQLEEKPWYYVDWKWEHEKAIQFIPSGSKVLEIGCAKGSFLDRLQKNGCEAVGLELNPSAVASARKRGVTVLEETVQDHALTNRQDYDVVCLFQVLEHIAEVRDFLNAAISLLRKEGHLIISVPDNSEKEYRSLILNDSNILDMPPHHMGLWGNVALVNLGEIFPIRLEHMVAEPAQPHHLLSYRGLIRERLETKYGFAGRLYYYLIRRVLSSTLKNLTAYLPGHTIIAIYRHEVS